MRRYMIRNWRFQALTTLLLLLFFYCLDFSFGYFFPSYPKYLNKKYFSWDSYETNPRGYFDIKKTGPDNQVYYTLDRSHEGDRKHERTSFAQNSINILAVGDSFTAGQGVKLKDTFIKRLETFSFPKKVYGLNYAEGGANIPEIHEQLMRFYKSPHKREPKLVVYGYVLNDPYVNPNPGVEFAGLDQNASLYANDKSDCGLAYDFINLRVNVIRSMRSPILGWLARHSAIIDYALATIERRDISKKTVQFYLDVHDLNKNLKGLLRTFNAIQEMHDVTEKHGGKFLVMIFPIFHDLGVKYPFGPAHRLVNELLQDRKIMTLDLLPAYSSSRAEDLWVHPVDQHPNEIAQGIAANELKKWIDQHPEIFN